MIKSWKYALAAASLLVAPATVRAEDPAPVVSKLAGAWEGRWEFPGTEGGKLTAQFTLAKDKLKGTTVWYATAVGDHTDTMSKVKIAGTKITVSESVMDFEATLTEAGGALTLTGTWSSPLASGAMTLKKKAE